MKIAILINSLKSGGAEKQSAILAKIMSQNHEVIYIIFDGNDANASFVEILNQGKNIKVIHLDSGKFKAIPRVIQIFKKEKPHFSFSYLPFGNFVNGVAGKIASVKNVIGGIRNSEVECYKFFFEKLSHNLFLNFSISNSMAGVNWHKNKGFKKDIFYIPNCYPLNIDEIKRPSDNRAIKILTVGRFVDQKNYPLALNAFRLILNKYRKSSVKITFCIVGYGPLEAIIRKMINDLGLNNNVSFIINPANILEYYRSADIYLSTSKFEGMSNSIMEAMSYSLPIVATNVGDNAELVIDEENGFLTESEECSIVESLSALIDTPALRNQFGSNSYNRLKSNFSEEAFLSKYESIINLK